MTDDKTMPTTTLEAFPPAQNESPAERIARKLVENPGAAKRLVDFLNSPDSPDDGAVLTLKTEMEERDG